MTRGGPEGNERLTVLTGLLLLALLAVLGVTIVWIGQLLWLHLFLGLLLIGPVVLKLLSTGYRFVRYYTASPTYRSKGPPPRILRLLGPLVVLSTLAVFGTGVGLLLLGPSSRHPLLLLHKVSFFAWIAFTGVHVLGHLRETLHYLRRADAASSRGRRHLPRTSVAAAVASSRLCWRCFVVWRWRWFDFAVRCVDTLSIWSAWMRSASVGQAAAARRANCSSSGGSGASPIIG